MQCGKEFVTTKYRLKDNKVGVFCSRKCYAEYKKQEMAGENNPNYKGKLLVTCDNCGKSFERIPSTANLANKDGEVHNFCCKQCYYQFRSSYYTGDKLYNNGIKMPKNFCDKIRKATLRQYQNGILDRQTKPQKIINHILQKNNISYINEKIFGYYAVDNYLSDAHLIIEVMGDYFHANPTKYLTYDNLNQMQQKDVIRDKRKHTYINKYYHIQILYLWESDILHRPDVCEALIKLYISNEGELTDCHSFNYLLNYNCLEPKNDIVNPYFVI